MPTEHVINDAEWQICIAYKEPMAPQHWRHNKANSCNDALRAESMYLKEHQKFDINIYPCCTLSYAVEHSHTGQVHCNT